MTPIIIVVNRNPDLPPNSIKLNRTKDIALATPPHNRPAVMPSIISKVLFSEVAVIFVLVVILLSLGRVRRAFLGLCVEFLLPDLAFRL